MKKRGTTANLAILVLGLGVIISAVGFFVYKTSKQVLAIGQLLIVIGSCINLVRLLALLKQGRDDGDRK